MPNLRSLLPIVIASTLLSVQSQAAETNGLDLLGDEEATASANATTPPDAAPDPGSRVDSDADLAAARRAQAQASGLVLQGLDSIRRYNQDQARNATAIVDAAIAFGKARAMLPRGTDPEVVAEIQANLYWCKKQMNLDALKDYIAHKGPDFQVATAQMDAVAQAKVDPAYAKAYFSRAERYAVAHPDEPLQIAIHFTEVAERFPGSPEGTEANRRSAAAVQAQMRAIQEAAVTARETRFTKVQRVVAGVTPVPSSQSQKDALSLLRKTYSAQYAKRDQGSKGRLSRKLLADSVKNKTDPAIYHQMLSESIRLASESEAYEPLLDAADRLAAAFADVDAKDEKLAAMKRLGSRAVAGAITKLLVEPRDPEANLVAGKWYCFTARRWDDGLRMLALGTDDDLAKLAQMEIAKPKGTSEGLQTADTWYDLGQKQRAKEDKMGMLGRAMYWYKDITSGLEGVAKQRVAERIAEIDKVLPLDPDNIDWANLTANQWDKIKGRVVAVNARVDRFDPGVSMGPNDRVRVVPCPTDTWSIVFDGWYTGTARTEACDWRGYKSNTYFYGEGHFSPGALMVWVEKGDKQNAGIINGPGRIYFSPHILWATGDRTGIIRVKLVPAADDE